MKTLKINSSSKKMVTRELISRLGEKIYHSQGVDAILLKVKFNDGSSISFKRSELGDKFERAIAEEDEED